MTSSTQQSPRTMLSWLNAIAHALEARGIKSQALFEKADIPYPSTVEPTYRVESHKASALLELAVEVTKDPAFGLKLVPYLHAANLQALGFALFSSSTLHEFCLRLVRFIRLLSERSEHFLHEETNTFKLSLILTFPDLGHESVDTWMGAVVHFCRCIYRPDFAPVRVELMRPRPTSNAKDFELFFNTPVIFSAEENALYFDKNDMFVPWPTASKELARRNDEIVIEHLARLDREDIVRQVEARIIELLPTGDCSREKIASLLHMSSRNMLNKLEQKNTSYKEILENLRSTLARQYIEQQNMQISEITFVLGFSDTSSFSRAFRRWTGLSPSDYRAKKSPCNNTTVSD
jgi:AraC-like DNA-binding protein